MVLQTLHGEVIGVIGSYFELDMQIKFADVSEISFKVPAYDNGMPTPLYDDIQSYRMVQIDPYGIYVLQEPNVSGDGIQEVKEVSASSIEILLSNKRIVLEEGTYPLSAIMDIVHDIAPDWTVEIHGTVGSNFRTFDETDESLLDWLRGTAAKSYGCLFECDPYTMTIHVIDAYENYDIVPIYLTYDNLLKQQDVSVSIKDFFTVLKVSGADPVDIHYVNPLGTNRIYNLDYFIENGDIEEPLASKWRAWQNEVDQKRDYFISISTLYNSAIMRERHQRDKIATLKEELTIFKSDEDFIQHELVNATTDALRQEKEREYSAKMDEVVSKNNELVYAESQLADMQSDIDSHNARIDEVIDQLTLENYFTTSEMEILSHYFIESDFTDDTFATFDVDITGTDNEYENAESAVMSVMPAKEDDIIDVDVDSIDPDGIINKRIILLNGGAIDITVNGLHISAEILSGTFEQDDASGDVVCSIYTGYGTSERDCVTKVFGNGNVTITAGDCTCASGTNPLSSASLTDVDLYFTRDTTQFQSYAIQKELYEHAVKEHEKIAFPGCEFDIKSGNILFAKEFEQFRDVLTLGKGLFLELSDRTVITPLLLEVHFSFEDPTNFDLIFSNTFQRHNNVTNMKELLEQARSTSRTLDMAKYNYGAFKRNGAENEVRTLFTQGLDVGSKQILAGRNNSVVIDGAGITISNPDDATVTLRMNNGMFTFMDESNHAQLAIGKFYDTGLGKTTYGVVAPNVVGTLLAGENLVINSPKFDGTNMFFTVDANGARLANGQFDIYKHTESGGQDVWGKTISLDPNLGILAGNLDNAIVYDTNGNILGVNAGNSITVKSLSELQSKGSLVPNFWVDLNGDVFMKGTIYATDGVFTGTIHATNGDFTGTLSAPTLSGKMSVDGTSGGTIRGASISVGGTEANPNFLVDSSGNVTMKGNIVLNGNITWGTESEPTAAADSIANGTYSGGSFIDGTTIRAPHIYGDAILGVGANGGTYEDESKNYNFYVDSDGNVVMNGSITLNGNITWGAGANIPATSITRDNMVDALRNASSGLPDGIYAYSYNDSGTTKYAIGINASYIKTGTIDTTRLSADVITTNTFSAQNINANKINSGSLDVSAIGITDKNGSTGGIMKGYGNNGSNDTPGVKLYGGTDTGSTTGNYFMATSSGSIMRAGSARIYIIPTQCAIDTTYTAGATDNCYISVYDARSLGPGPDNDQHINIIADDGTIALRARSATLNGSVISTSDRNLKNSISYDMDKYESLFMNLKPAFFKMNDGTSGRFHTGFIAQDVEEAIESSGLDTIDFAAFVSGKNYERSGNTEYSVTDVKSLRYSEFISLNTYMIQKLCARIEELENQISLLSGGNE